MCIRRKGASEHEISAAQKLTDGGHWFLPGRKFGLPVARVCAYEGKACPSTKFRAEISAAPTLTDGGRWFPLTDRDFGLPIQQMRPVDGLLLLRSRLGGRGHR